MTYWQAEALRDISRSGEYEQTPTGRWVTLFGEPAKYRVITNRSMQAFIKKGWVKLCPLVIDPQRIVARLTRQGQYEMARYYARHYKAQEASWKRIIEAHERG